MKEKLSSLLTVERVKKKWKNIRDHYRKELKKMQAAGNEETKRTHSPNRMFNQMSFMKEQILRKRPTKRRPAKQTSNTTDSDSATDDTDGNENGSRVTSLHTTDPPFKKRKEIDARSEFLDLEKRKLATYECIVKNRAQGVPFESEDYHFLMSLLPQMEKFTTIQRFRVRSQINTIIMTELRQNEFKNPNADYDFN